MAICPALGNWDRWTVENGAVTLTVALCGGLLGGLLLVDLDDGAHTRRRRPVPPGRFRLRPGESAAASGRTWGVLLHQDGGTRTLTVSMDEFRPGQRLDVHLVFAQEGPMNCFRASGTAGLGDAVWDFQLSRSVAVLEQVRRGGTLD